MYKGKSIAVVVPAFNECRLVKRTLDSVPSYVDRLYAVNDASTDATLSIMLEQAERDTRISVINRQTNGGVGASIVLGYKMALKERIDIVAVMAGDGQMDPQFLPDLLDPIIEGKAEYTKGNRLFREDLRGQMTSWRYFGNVVLTYLNKIASGYWDVVDPQNGYTAITRRALSILDLDRIYPRFAFENDMLVKLNIHDVRVLNMPIPARYGEEKSRITYGSFIAGTSAFFVRAFCWRLWNKYVSRGENGEGNSPGAQPVSACSSITGSNRSNAAFALDTQKESVSMEDRRGGSVSENDTTNHPIGCSEL
jgi:glycosyltransferase involved in cell wall biosynthesis